MPIYIFRRDFDIGKLPGDFPKMKWANNLCSKVTQVSITLALVIMTTIVLDMFQMRLKYYSPNKSETVTTSTTSIPLAETNADNTLNYIKESFRNSGRYHSSLKILKRSVYPVQLSFERKIQT